MVSEQPEVFQKIKLQCLEFARRLNFDEAHGETVAKFATMLFDQTKKLHGLKKEFRDLLELAGLLHDIGYCINERAHHKHSYYIISSAKFQGLSSREQEIVANVARYHRKSAPKLSHESFASLDSADRATVTHLAALLRVADALDRSHRRAVENFGLILDDASKQKRGLRFTINGTGDLSAEREAIKNKAELFESIYNLDFRLEE